MRNSLFSRQRVQSSRFRVQRFRVHFSAPVPRKAALKRALQSLAQINSREATPLGCLLLLGCLFLSLLAGCTDHPTAAQQQSLAAMRTDLDQKQYDQVLAKSDQFLRQTPQGPSAAHALYLRGRALAERTAATPAEVQQNLQQARTAYEQALAQSPPPLLDAYIRTSLANAAYFQEDYATAYQQWMQAYPKLDQDELKAWSLYRAGVSQQRLGQFLDADRTLAQVQQNHPNTVPAQRAADRIGTRGFYVQLATFKSAASADKAANELRAQGVVPQRTTSPQGWQVLRLGPVSTYADAKRLQQRFANKYADSLIVP